MKTCKTCMLSTNEPEKWFYKSKRGFQSNCKECAKRINSKRQREGRVLDRRFKEPKIKTCKLCGIQPTEEVPIEDMFYKSKNQKYYSSYCHPCIKKKRKTFPSYIDGNKFPRQFSSYYKMRACKKKEMIRENIKSRFRLWCINGGEFI